jgi:hypothetical protein
MTQRIRESFDAYLDRIGLTDSGLVQKRELRRAFFAGAWEVLCALEGAGDAMCDGSMSDDDGVALLGAMTAECEEFCARVLEGKD